ncbi:MAG: hypothetical protein V7K53_21070 [Nostoc sp.]
MTNDSHRQLALITPTYLNFKDFEGTVENIETRSSVKNTIRLKAPKNNHR